MRDLALMTAQLMTARWQRLLMVNFAVDPRVLAGRVPAGTQLDRFRGTAFVSLVGFLFRDLRVGGVPIPGLGSFAEVNLRFYVVRRTGDELRRGVVFVREVAPSRLLAWAAGWLYHERYVAAPVEATWHATGDGPERVTDVGYAFRRGEEHLRIRGRALGEPVLPAPDSAEEFFVEHYWGYGRRRDGGTHEYRVWHPPWRVTPVVDAEFHGHVAGLYGAELHDALQQPPVSALLAEGSPVSLSWRRRLAPAGTSFEDAGDEIPPAAASQPPRRLETCRPPT